MSETIVCRPNGQTRLPVDAEEIVRLVAHALLTEARLTPKPGLVDIRNSGAHEDMDLATFEKSAAVIAPWMEKFYLMGFNTAELASEEVLAMLRPIGIACEAEMLLATDGVNTHRGAIFAFGLLSAAAGRLSAEGQPLEQNRLCNQVAKFCRNIVANELTHGSRQQLSRGELHFLRHGVAGARGEAESGFQTVRTRALPVFNQVIARHKDVQLALLQALLHLMAWNEDTNLVTRGGLKGLYYVQSQAQQLLWEGGVLVAGGMDALQQLDDELIARHLSPGGSADLLAVVFFLSHFPPGPLYTH